MEQLAKAVKPFLEYDLLVEKLTSRGMILRDSLRAQRKLTQIGYYRLSGYWHPALKYKFIQPKEIIKYDEFQTGTTFDSIFDFYLFDKKIRLELLCAIERIEIYLRTIVAHELGRIHPQAHFDKKNFSRFSTSIEKGDRFSEFELWHRKHQQLLEDSREDSIRSHIDNEKPIPIWVACEAWNFGTLSKLYSMLSGANQQMICDRLGIDKRQVLDNWLINLNGIRNRCAHHSRVCNRSNIRTIMTPKNGYFNLIALGSSESNKLYGLVVVIWFLLSKIGPSSDWINRMADLLDDKPEVIGLTFKSMELPETGFPRKLFPKTIRTEPDIPVFADLIESANNQNLQILDMLREKKHDSEVDHELLKRTVESLLELAMKLEEL